MLVYTPWAVINYLSDFCSVGKTEPESYWTRSGASTILSNLLEAGVTENLQTKFIALSQGEKQELKFDKKLSLFKCNHDDYKHIERIFAYLLIAEKISFDRYMCHVPNFEVKQEFSDCINEQMERRRAFEVHDPFVEGMIKVNETSLREIVTQYVLETFSTLDLPKSDSGRSFTSEHSYRMFVLGLLNRMHKTHIIKSEAESGYGRADILLRPRSIESKFSQHEEGTGFIIELKHGTQGAKLQEPAQSGLEQIKSKKYQTELDQHKCKNQVYISFAFYSQSAEVLIEHHLSASFNPDIEWGYASAKMSEYMW